MAPFLAGKSGITTRVYQADRSRLIRLLRAVIVIDVIEKKHRCHRQEEKEEEAPHSYLMNEVSDFVKAKSLSCREAFSSSRSPKPMKFAGTRARLQQRFNMSELGERSSIFQEQLALNLRVSSKTRCLKLTRR